MESRTLRDTVKSQRQQELENSLQSQINNLTAEGYDVSFGYIGNRTTYALLTRGTEEVVGYTYIRGDLKYKNDTVGRSRALTQAIARKNVLTNTVSVPAKIEVPDIPSI